MDIALVLVVFIVALILFATERLAVDVTALLVLVVLLLSGLISPKEAFLGFGSDTVIIIACLFILTRALLRTGVIEGIGQALGKRIRSSKSLLRAMLAVVGVISAFVSNTATTAVFLPIFLSLSKRLKLAPSQTLMPLAFVSILGGSMTLIGTSTNLVVSGMLAHYHLQPFGFFELAWVGVPVFVVGLLYLYFIAPKLLPQHHNDLASSYKLRDYISDLTLKEGSALIGKTIKNMNVGKNYSLQILMVRRGEAFFLQQDMLELVLQVGDTLVAEGESSDILTAKNALGLFNKSESLALKKDDFKLLETVIMPRSGLLDKTLKEAGFREHFGLSVLGIHRVRGNHTTPLPLAHTRLQVGDVLLIQGDAANVHQLDDSLVVLDDISTQQRNTTKALLASGAFVLPIALSIANVIPFATALIASVLLVVLFKIIQPEEAYHSIEWSVLVLIACMLTFGKVFEDSGTAAWLANMLVDVLKPLGAYGVLAAFYVLTVVLTQPMSNQAAALVVLPLAIAVAEKMQLNPHTFAVAIAVAASNSFITPLEPSSLLVYGSGRYTFRDFMRVGLGLTLLCFVVAMIVIPRVWGF